MSSVGGRVAAAAVAAALTGGAYLLGILSVAGTCATRIRFVRRGFVATGVSRRVLGRAVGRE